MLREWEHSINENLIIAFVAVCHLYDNFYIGSKKRPDTALVVLYIFYYLNISFTIREFYNCFLFKNY